VPNELIIGYNPMPAAQRVALLARGIRGRLAWVGIALVVCIWIYLWQRNSLTPTMVAWLFGAGLGYSLIWLIMSIIQWGRAKSALSSIAPGVAARIDRQGIWLQGVFLPWPAIAQIVARSRRFSMAPRLQIIGLDGQRYRLDLGELDIMPGTIDASIRTFSGGTHSIDTSKLGN